MKKGLFLCLTALAVVFLTVSCSGSPNSKRADPNTPPWLNDLPPADEIWGIGAAKQSSEQMSMTMAETRARAGIARQLNAKVEDMITDYTRDAGTTASQTALSLQEVVTRQVTSMQLKGVQPIRKWRAPDGTYWYLVSYPKAEAEKALTELITNAVDNEAARFAEFKADEALRMLDAQLARNVKPEPVDR
ncbi:hypothetical protein AGMMS49944_20960 [Spirochaetia bacterium]|nr:hypothetical protein AGMMS49944_20960 [Spirochaetia bacterium]